MYIHTQEDFEAFIKRASSYNVLALDTEFMREKTYYPQLCLLQMATTDEDVIVDPFEIDNLKPLESLLLNKSITKVFHAGSQDIEILYNELGLIPDPIFDTQIAASLLGHTLQIGYGSLVTSMLGFTISKSDSFTDWARRPLSSSQLKYAAEDVLYLPPLYTKQVDKLNELGRLSWLKDEFRELQNPTNYEADPRQRYLKLKRVNQLSRKQLCIARELAEWRELKAQKNNIPRKWVLTDEQIIETCKRKPNTIDQLFMVRGIEDKLTVQDARDVLKAIERALKVPEDQWPRIQYANKNESNVDVEVDVLSALARLRAKENNIAFGALVSMTDLTSIARGHKDCAALQGWRRKIVGDDLLAFMEGKLIITIDNGILKVTNKQ